jgi:hypothetical protein
MRLRKALHVAVSALVALTLLAYMQMASEYTPCRFPELDEPDTTWSEIMRQYMGYRRCVLSRPGALSQSRVLVFEPTNGLGNRVLGTVSAFVLGVLTRRVVVVDWTPGDNHVFYGDNLFTDLSRAHVHDAVGFFRWCASCDLRN